MSDMATLERVKSPEDIDDSVEIAPAAVEIGPQTQILIEALDQHLTEISPQLEPSTTRLIQRAIEMLRKGNPREDIVSLLEPALEEIEREEEEWETAAASLQHVISLLKPRGSEQPLSKNIPEHLSLADQARWKIGLRIDRYIQQYYGDKDFVALAERIKQGIVSGEDVYQLSKLAVDAYEKDTTNNQHFMDLANSIALRLPHIAEGVFTEDNDARLIEKSKKEVRAIRDELILVIEERIKLIPTDNSRDREIGTYLQYVAGQLNRKPLNTENLQIAVKDINNITQEFWAR
ncbi:hypothetical protein KC573_03735, partial [candidate division WWE3 bacterium]|nr:hypothetical protein [candidate division WWE3 bacterium]